MYPSNLKGAQTVFNFNVDNQSSPALSKKRKNQEEVEYSKPTKRRTDPLVELADLFEAIIAQLIASPDAYPFCHPVSQHNAPDYYKIISDPIALEVIRDVNLFDLENSHLSLYDGIHIPG